MLQEKRQLQRQALYKFTRDTVVNI